MTSVLTYSVVWLGSASDVLAKGGEYGILEGRTAALVHPLTMSILFVASLYTGFTGLQWRKLREIGSELRDLSNKLPLISTGKAKSPISESVSVINSEISSLSSLDTEEAKTKISALKADLTLLSSPAVQEMDARIKELTATRKSLQGQDLRDKHWNSGSVLLGAGVGMSLLGGLNTYSRAGKLFPSPHLFAGVAITGLWALAAAMVPAMQKGNETARSAHIAFNSINVALFAWQVVTGIQILLKVIEFTKWP
eukprot:CAMPEP_0182427588 /NCGR_PEP_ID=MMETSP1167-20130531/18803_1 /TAXON_ID=2988 /ORGANISM="Mallomonas Sp, Strain CCMP3275" /LENGTH=252 /DNA_ID=CAMNT_0024609923 /DNA_START=240 /DNA_END=998 /DNA_ORIENTATION=+